MTTHARKLALCIACALGLSGWATAAVAQERFPTPDAAADALVEALGTDKADTARLEALLGKDWGDFIPTGGVARPDVDYFLEAYGNGHDLQVDGDTAHLRVGEGHWTLPIPITQGSGGWAFDTRAAADEIRTRRIGVNESQTLLSMLAYHDAQMDYAAQDRDDDGVLEYATQILSTEGEHDGLYWSEDATGDLSPLGPLFADAKAGEGWHGYRFQVLTAQGPSAPGGAYDYRLGDDMSRGFAAVAWPQEYGESGIMSFMISHDGQVFEKDLGADGAATAQAMKAFDPDSSWEEVADPMVVKVETP